MAGDYATMTTGELFKALSQKDAEIERLRDLFRVDGEQHATRIREMEKAHDARVAKYYEALEAERAKLSKAVEVMHTAYLTGMLNPIRAFLAGMEKKDDV
jgi:CHASE3 domain sensor protein